MKKNELTKEELMAIAGGQGELNLAALAEDSSCEELIRRVRAREDLADLLKDPDRRRLEMLIKSRQGLRDEITRRRLSRPVVMQRELAETRNLQ